MKLFIRRWQNLLMALFIFALFCTGVRLYPHTPLSENILFSNVFYDDHHNLLRLSLTNDEKYRVWTPLQDISPLVKEGVLLYEDRWFYYHAGFNPTSLMRAAWKSYISKESRQGGSTITMQLARMHWRLNTKTPYGKLIQIFRSIQLELCYSKDAILEAYLNYAPYGRNIESIGSASLIYFNKTPSELNLQEALTLSVLPQSPSYRIDKHTGFVEHSLRNARNALFETWKKTHTTNSFDEALFQLPLSLKQPEALPFIAPHFTNRILLEHKKAAKNGEVIYTTLDSTLQKILETSIQSYVKRNSTKGILNASALLVDTRTMHIKAFVGSANYFDASIDGQVDGTSAKRSPGSTLKPFIYALGFDQGLIHPMSILKDVPTTFGIYTPENFDLKFQGPISVTNALIYSRNIPAVTVASKLQEPNLYQFLRRAGIGRMASEGYYGLALSLGGGEVSMQELARLYAMLENNGILKPLIWENSQTPPTSELRVLSDEASFMTLDILSHNPRPQQSLSEKKFPFSIQWKTGTSWGFRDAWSIGIVGPYVLAVWIGNFDGKSNPFFIGQTAAAPLFFEMIDGIYAQYPDLSDPKKPLPQNLKQVDICLASGNLVTQWCQQQGQTWFIPGKSPIAIDTIFRPVPIDTATRKVACFPYDKTKTTIEVFEFWPSDILKLFEQAGTPKKTPPSFRECAQQNFSSNQDEIHITSPSEFVTYTFYRSKMQKQYIHLNATVDAQVHTVYWFANSVYLGKSSAKSSFEWQPDSHGHYTILAVDDRGNSNQKSINVSILP